MSYYYEQCKQPCLPPPICLQKCAKCPEPCAAQCHDQMCPPAKCHQVCPPAKCHQMCPPAVWDSLCPPAKCHQVCPPAIRGSEDLQPLQEILLGPQVALVTRSVTRTIPGKPGFGIFISPLSHPRYPGFPAFPCLSVGTFQVPLAPSLI
uniref:Uncharacterized protein n=1 Tax=Cyanistes caeruleus TaxID=156563 RepID=A0A8C0UI34_CYACU